MVHRAKHEYGYLSAEDFENFVKPIWRTADCMYAVIWTIMRYEGAAPIEACSMNLRDLDFRKGTWVYRRPKTDHVHIKPLAPRVREALLWWIELNKHRMINGYIFPAIHSKRLFTSPNTACQKFRYWIRKQGINCDFVIDTNLGLPNAGRKLHLLRQYDLRASWGEDYAESEGDYAAGVALGHNDPRSIWNYRRRIHLRKQSDVLAHMYPADRKGVWRNQHGNGIISKVRRTPAYHAALRYGYASKKDTEASEV